jgi:hypothetical protein
MMQGGFIKLWRNLLAHPIMQHDGLCRLWVHCLLRAEWKDARILIPGATETVEVPRGSFMTSRARLHAEMYPTGQDRREIPVPAALTLWRWLQGLESMGCLVIKNVNNRYTMITVCNYETYQSKGDEYEQPVNNPRTTHEQPILIDEEEEEVEEGREPEFDPLSPTLPPILKTPAFSRVWADLVAYRRRRRLSVREPWCLKQLKHLATFSEAIAIKAIEETVRNEWQGIFPEKYAGKGATKTTLTDAAKSALLWATQGESNDPT